MGTKGATTTPADGERRDFTRKASCPSCGAPMEWWGEAGWRCPWSTAANRAVAQVGGVVSLACANDLLRRNDIEAPVRGGRA